MELTVEALDSRQKRWDWEWIICYHIREWERRNAQECEKEGHTLLHGHFAWYHWHEICDRVLTRARNALKDEKDELLRPGNHEAQWEFSKRICTHMVYPECRVEFMAFARALREHGLPLYQEPASRRKKKKRG